MLSRSEEETKHEAELVAVELRALTTRRPVALNEFATCLEGSHAHSKLFVAGLERIADRAFVFPEDGGPLCTVVLSELYHCVDYVEAVKKLMELGKIPGRIVN